MSELSAGKVMGSPTLKYVVKYSALLLMFAMITLADMVGGTTILACFGALGVAANMSPTDDVGDEKFDEPVVCLREVSGAMVCSIGDLFDDEVDTSASRYIDGVLNTAVGN
jgi:hypothetical protein